VVTPCLNHTRPNHRIFPTQARAIRRFQRDVGLKEDQAAGFYRAACRQMRIESPYTDIGPGFSNFSEGTMAYLLGEFLYSSCKMDKGFEMYARPLHRTHAQRRTSHSLA
jgi:hypothetical protein